MRLLADLSREALELPAEQRLQLARQLLETTELDSDPNAQAQALWETEIEARLAAVKDGTARSRSAATVFADLDHQFPG